MAGNTIKDVALKAGVSFTTVSHVLNGTRNVSEASRAKVDKAIAELGFVPSGLARSLKTNSTHMIGVLVPNIVNPFFAEITRGIEDRCREAGYAVFLCNCDDDVTRQAAYVRMLVQHRVDGLLMAVAAGQTEQLSQVLSELGRPAVVVDRHLSGHDGDLLRVDHESGARLAAEHLLSLGHRRIACLAGPAEFEFSAARVAGWQQALRRAGITPEPDWLLEGDFSLESGFRLCTELFKSARVTAVFAGNDLSAIGAVRAAADLGLVVPRDVSVIGFDAIEIGKFLNPRLTSVGYPARSLGDSAAALLLRRLAEPSARSREMILMPTLVQRESTAPPPPT